ncbi:hypothetical protein C5167_036499 [Papaver somniferum]|uniref:Uncharacterized protein n=1 Tax=Papaver somniferum TaxID=3469 RepID=A0A4Y7I815_PAPSO|nr:hypothetical protein C5167_036499 [Papaver somniferum]
MLNPWLNRMDCLISRPVKNSSSDEENNVHYCGVLLMKNELPADGEKLKQREGKKKQQRNKKKKKKEGKK